MSDQREALRKSLARETKAALITRMIALIEAAQYVSETDIHAATVVDVANINGSARITLDIDNATIGDLLYMRAGHGLTLTDDIDLADTIAGLADAVVEVVK